MALPKYMVVIEAIEQMIQKQEPDSMIPSERALSEQLDISRMTVRKAVEILTNQGKLYRVNNIGTFISSSKLYKVVNTLIGFTNEVEASGSKASSDLISFSEIKANPFIAGKLQIKEKTSVYQVVRTRKKDDDPVMVDISYFPKDLIPLTDEICKGSIYSYILDELELNIQSAIQEIKATFLPQEYKNYLTVPDHEPVIHVEMVGYLANGRVYEYANSYKDQSKYELVIQSMRQLITP